MTDQQKFLLNAALRALATGAIVAATQVIPVLSKGGYGDLSLYSAALAMGIGAAASVGVSLLTQFVGTANTNNFFD